MADDSRRAKELAEERALLDDLSFANKAAAIEVRKLVAAEKLLAAARRTNSDNTAELEANVTKLNKGLSATEKEINNQRLAVAKAEKSLELYNKRVDALASSAEGAAGAMDKMFGTGFSSYIDRTKTLGISLSGLLGGLVDYGKELDKVNVDMARTTGYGHALKGAFNEAHMEIGRFGGTMEQLGKVFGTLSTQYSRFNSLSDTQMKNLAVQTTEMEQIGVSADQAAAAYEGLSYAFGVTDAAMVSASKNMDKFAMSIGTVPSKVFEDIAALAPTLARFGASGISVFKNLAREARQLGLTTQAAFDLSELFDTFEGSANAAGRLNAQFGLQLNSVELMSANSDERLEMLRQEFDLQGKSYTLMNKREKQMVADILGVDEMTAGKALGNKMDLGGLAKEKDRKTPEFVQLEEIGKAIKEGQFKANNAQIDKTTQAIKTQALSLAGQPAMLNNIYRSIVNIGVLVAAMQAIQTVSSVVGTVSQFKSRGKGIDPPDGTGNKVKKTPGEQKGGNSGQRRKTRRAKTPDMPKTPPKAPKAPGFFSRMAGKAKGIAGKAAGKGGGILAKLGGKGIIQGLKKVPVIGALPSVGMAISRAMEGDFVGAAMEVGSAAANVGNMVAPGIGSAVALAIDGAIMARDMGVIMNKDGASPKAPPGLGTMSKVVRAGQSARAGAQTINIGEQKHVIKINEKEIVNITTPAVVKQIEPAK